MIRHVSTIYCVCSQAPQWRSEQTSCEGSWCSRLVSLCAVVPPHVVRDYLEKFNINARETVLDPFCGTGTTLVECKKLGISAIGVEANALAHFASSVKSNWDIDPDGLVAEAADAADHALAVLKRDGVEDDPAIFPSSAQIKI